MGGKAIFEEIITKNFPKLRKKSQVSGSKSVTDLKHDEYRENYIQAHHSQSDENQRKGENHITTQIKYLEK